MNEYDIIEDAPPVARWIEMDISYRIEGMKMHRRSVVQKLKESGVWSKDEIYDVFRIITKKIQAWEKLRGIDLHHFNAGNWLCEE